MSVTEVSGNVGAPSCARCILRGVMKKPAQQPYCKRLSHLLIVQVVAARADLASPGSK